MKPLYILGQLEEVSFKNAFMYDDNKLFEDLLRIKLDLVYLYERKNKNSY
jgi:hypothetical protein